MWLHSWDWTDDSLPLRLALTEIIAFDHGPVLKDLKLPVFHQGHTPHSAPQIDSRSNVKTLMGSAESHMKAEMELFFFKTVFGLSE